MNSTKNFKWVDRDTAASGLLQLAYYAPPYVSHLALSLQRAIRSNAITDELKAIALDLERHRWERFYAIYALAEVPGDTYFPDFADLMRHDLLARIRKYKESDPLTRHLHPRSPLETGDDHLREICALVRNHPSNLTWFFEILETVEEPILSRYLLLILMSRNLPQDILHQIDQKLSSLFSQHPEVFDLDIVSRISVYYRGTELQCLNMRMDKIVELCVNVQEPYPQLLYSLLNNWQALAEAVLVKRPDIEQFVFSERKRRDEIQERRDQFSSDYKETTIFKKFEKLYLRSVDGDQRAFRLLTGHARKWDGDIITRALATHFLGWLHPQFEVVNTFSLLLGYANDDWGDIAPYYSPIRVEAGQALYRIATPQAWEELVNGYFINTRNILQGFMEIWIRDLTDQLSGVGGDPRYPERIAGDISGRPWADALAEININGTGLENI